MPQAFDAVKPSRQGEVNSEVTHAGLTAEVGYAVGSSINSRSQR